MAGMNGPAQHGVARVNGVRIHYLRQGQGPLMVLLHGWPQTSFCWRKVMAPLAQHFTVIAPDLRGFGASDKPVTGYDVRTVATDIRELIKSLGFEKAILVGHDWGGLVARRLALDRPEVVERLVVVDIVPHEQIFTDHFTVPVAFGSWHYFFNAVPDLPELLVEGRVETFLRAFMRPRCYDPDFLGPEEMAEYVRAYSQQGALRGGFSYYRCMAKENRALDAESAGRRIEAPTLVLWGTEGGMGGPYPVLDMWRRECLDVRGRAIKRCGHYVAEEQPEVLVREILAFCKE